MRLIDPELIEAKRLVPLTKLMDAVEQLPFEQQEAIAEELCGAQEAVIHRLRGASEVSWSKRGWTGTSPYNSSAPPYRSANSRPALRPATDSTYMVRTPYWHAFGSLYDPERSIKECHFVIDRTRCQVQHGPPERSLDR
jgi:hypothetical protein